MKNKDSISIATWNVNSIRARMEILSNWLTESKPDIVLLQETKCLEEIFPSMDMHFLGYNYAISGQKSYNGVAILSRYPLNIELRSLPLYDIYEEDTEARYIECTIEIKGKILRVASVYVPNGDSMLPKGQTLEESKRFIYKLKFLDRLTTRMKEVAQYQDEIVVFGGDYNIAHEKIDLHSPQVAEGDVGFHPSERTRLNNIFDLGYADCFRILNKTQVAYSWWDYRTNAFARDRGWRLDYLIANQSAMQITQDCIIEKEMRALQKTSDHVPVVMKIEI